MAQQANTVPQVVAGPPVVPNQAAPQQAAGPAVQPAPPAPGVAQPNPAPAPSRSRHPRGPLPASSAPANSVGVPALLSIAAANPYFTVLRREENTFVPSAVHMFYMLGICDMLMANTSRFTQSSPGWLPIVSQLYISILWLVQITRIRVELRYGSPKENDLYRNLCDILQVQDLLIPGPLVPFFAALSASSAAFDWIGDFMPGLPSIAELIQAHPTVANQWQRIVPFPCVILDQLIAFSRIAGNNGDYTSFEWYRNIFGVTGSDNDPNHITVRWNRIGPNFVAPLYVNNSQHDSARAYWSAHLSSAGSYARYSRANAILITTFGQFTGFNDGNGHFKLDWFNNVSGIMAKYAMYFNGSMALKDISPSGLGAIIPRGIPSANQAVRDWLYPAGAPAVQKSNTFTPINPLPVELRVAFQHSDHDLEEQAEQYALLTHVNVDWTQNNLTQNNWSQLAHANSYVGSAWQMLEHRQSAPVTIHPAYVQTVASRYHQSVALKTN